MLCLNAHTFSFYFYFKKNWEIQNIKKSLSWCWNLRLLTLPICDFSLHFHLATAAALVLNILLINTHATELVLDHPGFSETFDLLDFSKWSRR